MIEKIQRVWFTATGRRHIRQDTVVPHAIMGNLVFGLLVTVIRPNPFIGYQSQGGRGLSRDTPLVYILSVFFRTMSDNVAKQMKGFDRKLPSQRRHLSLSSSGLTTSD